MNFFTNDSAHPRLHNPMIAMGISVVIQSNSSEDEILRDVLNEGASYC